MYNTSPPPRPVRLHGADGSVVVYASLSAFVASVGIHWLRIALGERFRACRCVTTCRVLDACPTVTYRPYVLRNAEGEVVSLEECEALWRTSRLSETRPRYGRYRYWNGEGAVPYTGRRRGGHWFRRVRTYAEHRAAAGVDSAEGEPAFRAARRRHNLPSAWDDLDISARRDRSWKRHRKTQWKPTVWRTRARATTSSDQGFLGLRGA